jgi:hypothetical protein
VKLQKHRNYESHPTTLKATKMTLFIITKEHGCRHKSKRGGLELYCGASAPQAPHNAYALEEG